MSKAAEVQRLSSEESDSEEFEEFQIHHILTGDGVIRKFTSLEPDAWGLVILTIVRDLCACRWGIVTAVHIGFATVLGSVNLWLQFVVLINVKKFIVGGAVHDTQKNYKQYHEEIFLPNGDFNRTAWKNWKDGPYMELCNLSMSKQDFTVAIIFLWTARMINELRSILRVSADLVNVKPLPTGAHANEMWQEVDNDDGEKEYHIVALSWPARFCIFLFVIIPKTLITIFLLYVGCRWLTATESFSDLILNALALEFVILIDESCYDAFAPKMLKDKLESAKFVVVRERAEDDERREAREVCFSYATSFAYVGICFLWTILYMNYFQTVIPEFHKDISNHCDGWFNKYYEPICPPMTKDPIETCFPYGGGKKAEL